VRLGGSGDRTGTRIKAERDEPTQVRSMNGVQPSPPTDEGPILSYMEEFEYLKLEHPVGTWSKQRAKSLDS